MQLNREVLIEPSVEFSSMKSLCFCLKLENYMSNCPRREFCPFISTCQCSLGQSLSHAQLFANPSTVAHQALLSMGLFLQGCWSGLPFPPPGTEPVPPVASALAGTFFTTESPGNEMSKPRSITCLVHIRFSTNVALIKK